MIPQDCLRRCALEGYRCESSISDESLGQDSSALFCDNRDVMIQRLVLRSFRANLLTMPSHPLCAKIEVAWLVLFLQCSLTK